MIIFYVRCFYFVLGYNLDDGITWMVETWKIEKVRCQRIEEVRIISLWSRSNTAFILVNF